MKNRQQPIRLRFSIQESETRFKMTVSEVHPGF